ncbi:DUF397 domain-containing protein [Nocardia wallacei]|uniref:DUF397 domain-containing protein n=1 Tax=Nocardia wallacei TaxID=480035 RepID=UPI0024564F3D|nr:DUF397 domain-containing protein [Nocardia wallacei]
MSVTDFAHATEWIKSSRSNGGQACVEVSFHRDTVLIRDSKYRRNPDNDPTLEPIIALTNQQWQAFLNTVTGKPTECAPLQLDTDRFGNITVRASDDTQLTYTPTEWDAFCRGVVDGGCVQLTADLGCR